MFAAACEARSPHGGRGPDARRAGVTAPDRWLHRLAACGRTTEEVAMAGSVNKVILVGNLGKDPEVRNTQDGTKIVNFTLATSETWNDRASGERKEKTEWHRVVIFNERIADVAEKYLRKGTQGLCRGRAADPQMDRPVRPGEIHHRGGDRPVPRRADDARRPRRRRGRRRHGPRHVRRRRASAAPARSGGGGAPRAARRAAAAAAAASVWDAPKRRRPGRRDPVLDSGREQAAGERSGLCRCDPLAACPGPALSGRRSSRRRPWRGPGHEPWPS